MLGVFNNKRNEIYLLEKKLDKEKAKEKYLEEKNRLLEWHNHMIDTNNNQLNRKNMLLLEKMRNMDKQIDRASVYTQRIYYNAQHVGKDVHRYQHNMNEIDAFFQEYRKQGFAFLLVNDDKKTKIDAFFQEYRKQGYAFLFVNDDDKKTSFQM